MAEKLSLTDYKLLNYLLEHDLQNYSKMAKEIKIPASTIYDRVKALREKGVIKRVAPELDLRKLGYKVFAMVEIVLGNFRDAEIIKEKFLNNKNVVGLFQISGDYDMLIIAIFRDTIEFGKLLSKLLAMKEVKDLKGHLVLHTYKFGQSPVPIEED